ncbi:MAG: aminodeoxychorismate synthase component I [Flavobacteriales bacterium]
MNTISFTINNKEELQEKLLHYFVEYKNLCFFNSNKSNINFIGVSRSNEVFDNKWKFGFIAYDYKNKIEQLTSNHIDNIGFEDEFFFTPEILFGITQKELEIQFNTQIYTEEEIQNIYNKILELEVEKSPINSPIAVPRISKQEYLNSVDKLKNHIQLGDIYEVNFCQEFYSNDAEINPVELYIKLNKKSPTPFSCFVKHDDKFLLSASPERFMKKQGNKITSQPIKGTIKRGLNQQEDEELKKQLQNDPKERSENIMIVDLVRNDLSKIANRQTVKVEELCEIYTFPQVHQMISTISAEIENNVSFNNIIHALFPMGSMTGAPKIRAMELIEQYESSKRGLYSGTVGYIKPNGDFDFNVVIRSILYNSSTKKMSYFVGSAITHLSDPEKEYEECLLKAKAINEVLNEDVKQV